MKRIIEKLSITLPVVFLAILLFIVNFSATLFAMFGKSLSSAFNLIYYFAFFWIMGWWLKEDISKHKEQWTYNVGFFIYIAWPVIIPIYLFKTRGVRAIISFFKLLVIYIGTFVAGLILSLLIRLFIP